MSNDNEIIYLKIPIKWNNTYYRLLYLVSIVGKDLIMNCVCNCSNECNSVFQCWNMFQSALAAKEYGDDKKAELLINNIEGQLKILYRNYNIDVPVINYISKTVWLGASSVEDAEKLVLDTLTKEKLTSVINNEVTVETTEDKPYIWFVSEIPLKFKQASIILAMNEYKINNLYYYRTDALIPGDDNKFYIYEEQ